jgi:hypothetical protein
MSHSLRTLLRDNGLSIVLVTLFAVFFVGQVITGRIEHNKQQAREGLPQVSYSEYLQSGDFLEATMENWESEFLQMACYVLLTAFLYQRGSAESKDPDEVEVTPSSRHSWWYENSLALALVGLFIMSFRVARDRRVARVQRGRIGTWYRRTAIAIRLSCDFALLV